MHRLWRGIAVLSTVALVMAPMAAGADDDADDHTENMKLEVNVPKSSEVTQSDFALWGDKMFAANYDGFRILDISDPVAPEVVTDFLCPASQNDISVWHDLLFLSVDGRRAVDGCLSEPAAADAEDAFEGVRVFDISDIKHPKPVKMVPTECGSHTHTLVPGPKNSQGKVDTLYLYVSSYPGASQVPTCPNDHHTVSVIKVPVGAPQKAKTIAPVDIGPNDGCHDITVFMQLKIAAAACQSEGQMWDISNPAKPKITTHIENDNISFWHTAGFTWDGKYVAFDDEFGGGGTPGCPPLLGTVGAVWFYEVADPSEPLGSFSIPRVQGTQTCTAHNFNMIPVTDRYLMVAAFYGGGTSVIDFTDPTAPEEIGYYDASDGGEADTWSSYFYNGYIFANDITRGVDVFSFDDPASQEAKHFKYLNPQTQMKVLEGP